MRWFGRLARSGEIAYVRRTGRRSSHAALTVFWTSAPSTRTTVAVTVSKSVGIAVVRNLVRRRIHGALDAAVIAPVTARRMLIVAKPAAAAVSFAALRSDVDAAVARVFR